MYYVRLEWKSECYSTFDVTYWNSEKKAQEKYRSILNDEYASLFGKKPPKKWSFKTVSELIDDKIENDKNSDYEFSCEIGTIVAEDNILIPENLQVQNQSNTL